MKHIVKTYGRVVANNDVSLSLGEGEILSIVGENGAGKSTIMKVLYGLERPDSGEIFVRGKKVAMRSPSDAISLGIGMVQQHFMLFAPMTVTENIIYNREISKWGFLNEKANREKVRELSEKYALRVDPDAIIEDCPVGAQQRVEILKTLYQNADIIIFDEPSAVLTPIEVDDLLATMKNLAAMGKSLILITHKLNEVMAVSDRVVVMRAGQVVGETRTKNTTAEELSYQMIGRRLEVQQIAPQQPGEDVLRVEGLSMASELGRKVLDDVSLHVARGEIVGIAGVSGNGQSELVRCVTGLERGYRGSVAVCGQDVSGKPVNVIREAGMTHIPEDRYEWGSARDASLTENALMGTEDTPAFSKRGVLRLREIREHVGGLIAKYSVKADSAAQKMRELSGGNAQKLITAREIEQHKPLLVAVEPTRGIDVGAQEFVHEQLIRKRAQGDGILLVSSELSEILKLSDRIYVMYEGKINHEFRQGTVNDRQLGILMTGGTLDAEQ